MENLNQQPVPLRPLGILKEVLDGLATEISYFYDDLVFVEHNLYLLQFGECGEEMFLWENEEATAEELAGQFERLAGALATCRIELKKKGRYRASESGDEQLQLTFLEGENS